MGRLTRRYLTTAKQQRRLVMKELKLDGNAAAGPLGEAICVFCGDVTTAEFACGGCGRTGALGEAMVYDIRALGLIIRCPDCDHALIRLAYLRNTRMLDLRGTRYLRLSMSGAAT
jgi:hypothetical protein